MGLILLDWVGFGRFGRSADFFQISSSNIALLELKALTCRLTTKGTNERNAKLGQGVSRRDYVTYF